MNNYRGQLFPESICGYDARALGAGLVLATGFVYALYRRLLPKPIPGDIPYDRASARSPLGDLPKLARELRTGGSFSSFFAKEADAHKSPIFQIFLQFPKSTKPMVVIDDPLELQDILLRRGAEFDRSQYISDFIRGTNEHAILGLKTSDPSFKYARLLMRDSMTPAFLRNVASPVIYDKVESLVRVWELQAEIADGRSFSAMDDLKNAAIEAVNAFSFGDVPEYDIFNNQAESLAALLRDGQLRKPQHGAGLDEDDEVVFPPAKIHNWIHDIIKCVEAFAYLVGNPLPDLTWKIMEKTFLRKEFAARDKFFNGQIARAKERLEQAGEVDGLNADGKWVKCAIDQMLMREKQAAEKDGREPNYFGSVMQADIQSFWVGGYDTTSTTLAWSFKILAQPQHQAIQTKLRQALREAMPEAWASRRMPTNAEIHDTAVPYLDATMEELFRHSRTIGTGFRDALCDTTLMGHAIPKGTIVASSTVGEGALRTPNMVDDKLRSKSSLQSKADGRAKIWDTSTLHLFVPERWLVPARKEGGLEKQQKNGSGEEDMEFDISAGPMFTFGLGKRGCFGRRLAYIEMRAVLTMVIWRFMLEPTPEKLSSWDVIDGLVGAPKQAYVRLRPAY